VAAPERTPRVRWQVTPTARSEAPALAALGAVSLARGWSPQAVARELVAREARAWTLRPAGPAAAEATGSAVAPVGFLLARTAPDALHVLLMAVAPALRRRGGGSALLAAAVAEAQAVRQTAVQLEVRAGNEAALAFYRERGFLAVGRRPRYYEGREDAVLMTLELEAGAAR
jgi:ribosomal-protein-alanine N-acetyltransferase